MMKAFDQRLTQACVGIAGLGGLGSTVAAALARTGVGRLVIVDFDEVDKSNLNRQQYYIDQVGQHKVDATHANLRRINRHMDITAHKQKLDADTVSEVFSTVDIVAECLDRVDQKQMLVETVLAQMTVPIVAVSGLAGFGASNDIRTRTISPRVVLVGDNQRGVDTGLPLTAGRVWIAAAHQANAIVELLLGKE